MGPVINPHNILTHHEDMSQQRKCAANKPKWPSINSSQQQNAKSWAPQPAPGPQFTSYSSYSISSYPSCSNTFITQYKDQLIELNDHVEGDHDWGGQECGEMSDSGEGVGSPQVEC